MKVKKSYNIELYIGSKNEDTDQDFTKEELMSEISLFQDEHYIMIPVCVSSVEFLCGVRYIEKGWKVSVINFPKINAKEKDLNEFMTNLARILLQVFKQNSICVVGSKKTIMVEK